MIIYEKNNSPINSPDELVKHLQSTSFVTWLILGVIFLMLVGLFAWSCIHELKIKLTGTAVINSGSVTLNINDSDLNKLKEGQKVCINGIEGKILSINEDNTPVVSAFDLSDGEYDYTIILEEKRPISFVFGSK